MRRFLIAVALLLGILFVIGHFTEMQSIWDTLKKGNWRFISLAGLVELLWLINLGATYQAIYHALGIHDRLKRLTLLASAANFTNVVAPSGGFSGMAVFISEARKTNLPSGKVTLAGILFLLLDYAAFLCVLTLGLFVLFRRNDLNAPEIIASLILFCLALGLTIMIYIGMRSPLSLGKILAWMARNINRIIRPFLHRAYLSEKRAFDFSNEVAEGLSVLRKNPRNLFIPFLHTLLNKILLVFILFLIFVAFKAPLSIGTIIAGWSMGYLFMIISPTPAGIGFVEGAMTLTISSFYVSLSTATILSLAYRGVTFWIQLLIGFLAFRSLENLIKPNLTN